MLVGLHDGVKVRYWDGGRRILETRDFIVERDSAPTLTDVPPPDYVITPSAEGENEQKNSQGNLGPASSGGETKATTVTEGETEATTANLKKMPLPPRAPSARIAAQPRPDYKTLNDGKISMVGTMNADVAYLSEYKEPSTYEEAVSSPEKDEWIAAMKREISNLEKQGTFTSVDPPKGRTPLGGKWVYKLKTAVKGHDISHEYKARFVAQGFRQIWGQDYEDTHAPVVRVETLRVILAVVAAFGWELEQMDVVGAYLNGILEEEIYIKPPPGFGDKSGSVWLLHKALYGLKQAGRVWNLEMHRRFISIGFKRLHSDPCLYLRIEETAREASLVAVHVDDMAVATDSNTTMAKTKRDLNSVFELKDLGELRHITGYEVTRDRKKGTLHVSQKHYIGKILEKYRMGEANPVGMPMDPGVNLSRSEMSAKYLPKDRKLDWPYAESVGSLMWAATGTRVDIAHATSIVAQYTMDPETQHETAVKRVMRYLKATVDVGITFHSNAEFELTGYSDADFANDERDRKSYSGYVFVLSGGPISWSSKKQSTVATSTMAAEYMAMDSATREAVWLRALLNEMGFYQNGSTTLYVDNRAAMELAKDNKYHDRAKHIDRSYHFIREHVAVGDIRVEHCSGEDNLADILTKALAKPRHELLVSKLGMA